MMILGFQGSPRKKGNTNYLLAAFMDEAENLGAQTRIVEVSKKNIVPCIGCGYCEKKGYCITKNDDIRGRPLPFLWPGPFGDLTLPGRNQWEYYRVLLRITRNDKP